MKLQQAVPTTQNVFTGYGNGYVAVNGRRIEKSVVVMPDRLVEPWDVQAFEELAALNFEFLASLGQEIVLLGTGERLRFPDPRLSQPLIKAKIGLEIMDSNAACRTYNVLMGEGRNVAAALILP